MMTFMRANTLLLRNINTKIDGKVNAIFFYKHKNVNDAIKDYAQKFDNWRDLYFKDLPLTKEKAEIFATEVKNAIDNNEKLVRSKIYKKVK